MIHRLATRAIASVVPCFLMAAGASATTWSIQPDGTGDAPTIQAGVNVAAAGDTLLLAAGTFVGDDNKNVFFAGKDLVVTSESGPASTVLDCEGSGRAFLYLLGETSASVLRGITIRNGNSGSSGGAVICTGASPTFVECVFENNTGAGGIGGGGGAVFCSSGSPTFDDCVFSNNSNPDAEGVAGAVSLWQCDDVTVTGCTFEENSASPDSLHGGGGGLLAWMGSKLTVTGCEFRGNISGAGGGLSIIVTTEATVETTSFTENIALSGGGLNSNAFDLRVADCAFVRNEAEKGAGAEVGTSTVEFVRCFFQQNASSDLGGGLATFQATVTLRECVLSKNTAVRGGAIFGGGSALVLESCTFHANDADPGSCLRMQPSGVADIASTIFAFNVGPVVSCTSSAEANVACSDVFGNAGGDYVGCLAGQNGIAGNFSADPLFCGPDDKDFTLRSDSPCAPPGVTACGLVGAMPVGCGPVAVEEDTWAGIKTRYRGGDRR